VYRSDHIFKAKLLYHFVLVFYCLLGINGEVIIAIIIAGEIAIVGPKYGTTLVTAAIEARYCDYYFTVYAIKIDYCVDVSSIY
jgi:hypothetical protein